ncbi:MAG: GNAT family N-acetyltransferase [Planctomycetota bacterium]
MPLKGIEIVEVEGSAGLDGALPLLRRAVGEGPNRDRAAAAERFAREALAGPDALLLLARGPGPVDLGVLFAAGSRNPFLGTSVPFLYALFVRPENRRAGLAAALLSRAEKIYRTRGFGALAAEVPYQDDALISMGERRGYVREREWMAKDL